MIKNRIFKSIISIIMVLSLMVGLIACDKDDTPSGTEPSKDALKTAIHQEIEAYFDSLDATSKNMIDFSNTKFESSLGVNLSEDLLTTIEQSLFPEGGGIDLSFINNIGISFAGNFKGNDMSANAGINYGDNTILGAEFIYPGIFEGGISDMYVTLAGLTDLAFKISMGDVSSDTPQAMNGMIVMLTEALKQASTMDTAAIYGPVEGLFIELIDAVIDAVNVKIEEGDVKAGGVKQDCVVYTIDPTDEQLIDVVLNVMNTLKDSKNLKALLVASAEMMDMDGEELHAQLVATISTTLEEMEETTDEAVDSIPDVIKGDMLNIDVYVTKDLAILGMEVEVNTAGGEYDFETDEYTYVKETVNIFFASTKSGEDVGVELSITANDETISISGKLKETNSKLNGEIALQVLGKDFVYIGIEDLDTAKLAQNLIDGAFTIEFGDDFIDNAIGENGEGSFVASILSTMKIKFELKQESFTDGSVTLSLLNGNVTLASVSGSVKFSEGETITIPGAGEYTENPELWLGGLGMQDIIDRITGAGVPQEVVDFILNAMTEVPAPDDSWEDDSWEDDSWEDDSWEDEDYWEDDEYEW